MQSLIIEAMGYSFHVPSLRENVIKLQNCLELMNAIETKKSKAEQRYALCRYNESLYTEADLGNNVAAELKRTMGYAPDWEFVKDMFVSHELSEEDEIIIEELSETNAIWWETEDGSCITLLPPRPLVEGDLNVRLVLTENGCTIVDADGDETPCERDEATLLLSQECEKRKGGYPLLSSCIERVESML